MLVNSIKTKNNFHNYIVIKQSDNTSAIEILLCGANGSILSDLNQSCTLTILDEVDQLIRQKTKEQIVNGTVTFRVANDLKTNPHTLEITTADGQKFPSNHDFKIFVSYTHDESELRVINNLSREEALAEIDQSVKRFISENTSEFIDKVATSEWLKENNFTPKDPVQTYNDLPMDAQLKELRGVITENSVYVFDGVKWIKQAEVNLDYWKVIKENVEQIQINTDKFNSIQEAIDYAPPNSVINVPFQNDTILTVTLIVEKPLKLQFNNNKFIVPLNKNLIDIIGNREVESYTLLNKASKNDNKIVLTKIPETLKAGDMIVIRDDSKRINDNTENMNLETHEIESIKESTIYLKGLIGWDKQVVPENVYKVVPVENVTISDLVAECSDDAVQGRIINADMVRNLKIFNVKSCKTTSPTIRTMRTLGIVIDGFNFSTPIGNNSGYGYGIQCYAGSKDVIIKNGFGYKMRHTLDFHSAYDVFIENIRTSHDTSSSIVLSHNGWGGRFNLRNITVENGDQYGISISGQGISVNDWENVSFDDLTIQNVKIHLKNDTLSQVGIKSDLPIRNFNFIHVEVIYKDGNVITNSTGAGLMIPPINSYGTVDNFSATGFYYIINEFFPINAAHKFPEFTVKYRNISAKNANIAFNSSVGTNKNIDISNFKVDNIVGSIFRLLGGSIKYISITDIFISNSSAAILFNNSATNLMTVGSLGDISSVDNLTSYLVEVKAGYVLTQADVYLMSRSSTINIFSSSPVTVGNNFIPDGIVLGQRLTILNTGASAITIPRTSKFLTKEIQSKQLAQHNSITMVWINGGWREV
ncbi:hypothetical protein ETI03_03290 [Macrococcoides canis]|uniref:hypothetical protein n=1 Tax=Macrococcoides canis TaxID=1855823 RepID=UPI00105EB6AA|nr:hypothetical protein [Macrococcus canis]TDM32738.1 hypothetical protein ETI03_03290 [Macrococcus canis]